MYKLLDRYIETTDRQKLMALQRTLLDAGYVHICSVSDDCGTGGLFYSHEDGRQAVIRRMAIIELPPVVRR